MPLKLACGKSRAQHNLPFEEHRPGVNPVRKEESLPNFRRWDSDESSRLLEHHLIGFPDDRALPRVSRTSTLRQSFQFLIQPGVRTCRRIRRLRLDSRTQQQGEQHYGERTRWLQNA